MFPRHQAAQPRQQHARADAHTADFVPDILQSRYPVEKGKFWWLFQLLGQHQADFGCAANQRGIGVLGIPGGEFINIGQPPLRKPCHQCRFIRPFRHRHLRRRLCRAQYRRIAGAAAQIARQHVLIILPPFALRRFQGHHDPRCAKAALRAVMRHQCLLHRVRPVQRLHRGCRFALYLPEQQNAGIDRAVFQRAFLESCQLYRAGPAIALVAAFLGAGQALLEAQKIQQGH